MKLNKNEMTTENYTELADYANKNDMIIEDKGTYWETITPTPLSLSEQASTMSMTKAEFLILVTGLTKTMPAPVTLEAIEALLAGDSDIRMRFTYANSVERNHPMLDGVSETFGVSAEMLDIMFVNKDVLIHAIDNNLSIPTEF